VVSHPFASNHPTDEDLSVGTPGRRKDGARELLGENRRRSIPGRNSRRRIRVLKMTVQL
jgi:hypothetical protein